MTARGGVAGVAVLAMRSGGVTHVGSVRSANEDAFLAGERLCVVADGMGGHEAGEVASSLVVKRFEEVTADHELEVAELEPLLSSINADIREVGRRNGTEGMGTTVVGVGLIGNGDTSSAVVFNIGDSRCYRLVGDSLTQVTSDHSYVQELVDSGEIAASAAASHPMRNVVTRALGVDERVVADFTVLDEVDCRLLLCSDGLSGEIGDADLRRVLAGQPDPQLAALELVEAALAGVASDNVTAVVVDVEFESPAADDTTPRDQLADVDITAPRALPPPTGLRRPLYPPLDSEEPT